MLLHKVTEMDPISNVENTAKYKFSHSQVW